MSLLPDNVKGGLKRVKSALALSDKKGDDEVARNRQYGFKLLHLEALKTRANKLDKQSEPGDLATKAHGAYLREHNRSLLDPNANPAAWKLHKDPKFRAEFYTSGVRQALANEKISHPHDVALWEAEAAHHKEHGTTHDRRHPDEAQDREVVRRVSHIGRCKSDNSPLLTIHPSARIQKFDRWRWASKGGGFPCCWSHTTAQRPT